MGHWNSIHRNNVLLHGNGKRTPVLVHGDGYDQTMWQWLEAPSRRRPADPVRRIRVRRLRPVGRRCRPAQPAGKLCRGSGRDLRGAHLHDGTLAGHSVSALIGRMASIAAPARIARLVMVCPSRCFFNVPGYDGGFEHCDFRNSSPKWTATISAGQTPCHRPIRRL